ncbi:putative F-box domain, leucine-rich repeat domain superfamily, F-box-like domain superfamily [Dioscorea sansibarensis]
MSSSFLNTFSFLRPQLSGQDHTLRLPDECLALIFQLLSTKDRNNSSIVSRRWYTIDRQSRYTLSISGFATLRDTASSIFSRFDSVTKLSLHFNRSSHCLSIGDDGITAVALHCSSLSDLELRNCHLITDAGIRSISKHCLKLKRISLHSCNFGPQGINSIIQHCSLLQDLSLSKFSRFSSPINGSKSLKIISLRYLYGGRALLPLISQSPNLKSLRIINCSGTWDKHLEEASLHANKIMDVLLEAIDVSDRGLRALSMQVNLETLWLADTHRCTDEGVISVIEKCKELKEIGIRKLKKVGEKSLVAIARKCVNLKLLALARVAVTGRSLVLVAQSCCSLESLLINGGKRIGDGEMMCVLAKCLGLRWLFIRGCPISDVLLDAIGKGCPKLEKLEIRKCARVTRKGVEELRGKRRGMSIDYVGIDEKDDEKVEDEEMQGERDEDIQEEEWGGSRLWLCLVAIWGFFVFILRKLLNR